MGEFQLKDNGEAYEVIKAAVDELRRGDTPFSYGVVIDETTDSQIVYFDLPRVSPLQFNISTAGITTRLQLIARIEEAILERLEIDYVMTSPVQHLRLECW